MEVNDLRINLYLHYPDDADLLLMRHSLGRKFGREVMKAVQAQARGVSYRIPCMMPDPVQDIVLKEELVSIKAAEENVPDAIRYIRSLPETHRCLAIKNIIRRSCQPFPVMIFERKQSPLLTLCLQGKRDKDLLIAYKALGKEGLSDLVKLSVRQFLAGAMSPFSVREQKIHFHTVYCEISIDPETDQDFITFLSSIEPDRTASYIKILIRRILTIKYDEVQPKEDRQKSAAKKKRSSGQKQQVSKDSGSRTHDPQKQYIPEALIAKVSSDKSDEELTDDVFDIFEGMS